MGSSVLILAALTCSGTAVVRAASCEEWCTNACDELNGNIESECGACDASDPKYMCHAEAEGFFVDLGQKSGGTSGSTSGGSSPRPSPAADGDVDVEDDHDHDDDPHYQQADHSSFEYVSPHNPEIGACEFGTIIDHALVNRTWLMQQTAPILIRGATENWAGRTKWSRDSMLGTYGDAAYHLETDGAVSLASALAVHSKYNMGHMVFPPEDCYAVRYRPYSPFLDTIAADYSIPHYLQPMRTFQMGIGSGAGIGVPPEQHPGAWFSAVVGRKRWILTPPGAKPPTAMRNTPGCKVQRKTTVSQLCDQLEGDTLWVPDFWWHETCGLDDYSAGIGGITYEGADARHGRRECGQGEYRVSDIPHCQVHKCPSIESIQSRQPRQPSS